MLILVHNITDTATETILYQWKPSVVAQYTPEPQHENKQGQHHNPRTTVIGTFHMSTVKFQGYL